MGKWNFKGLLLVCALSSGCATNSSPPPVAICPTLPPAPVAVMEKQAPNFLERSEKNLQQLLSDLGLSSTQSPATPTKRPAGSTPAR
ncbi:hypothetical protein VI26_18190 [Chromobacterium sp. LK1]|nr:hypothetical protein VI26_18190 [Chromobacterium sp. LK1]